jgi:hypothetical protein
MFTMRVFLIPFFVAIATSQKISNFFDESFQSQVEASPLHVELQTSEITGHIRAIVSNQGAKAAFFSTSGNPLSTGAESKVRVYNENEENISFLGPEAHQRNPAGVDYQMLSAGESVVREIGVTDYELNPGQQYFVQAAGYVPYYLEGQTSESALSQSAMFEANVLSFTAPETLSPKIKAVETPASPSIIFSGCKDKQVEALLEQMFALALNMTTRTIEYVNNGKDREAFKTWFKNDDAETRKAVLSRYLPIQKALSTKTGPITIQCAESDWGVNYCKQRQALAYTEPQLGRASFCPASKYYPAECKRCNDGNHAGNLIHEMTHMSPIFSPPTVDHCQGSTPCKALSPAKMIMNANNYNMLAQSIYLGKPC